MSKDFFLKLFKNSFILCNAVFTLSLLLAAIFQIKIIVGILSYSLPCVLLGTTISYLLLMSKKNLRNRATIVVISSLSFFLFSIKISSNIEDLFANSFGLIASLFITFSFLNEARYNGEKME